MKFVPIAVLNILFACSLGSSQNPAPPGPDAGDPPPQATAAAGSAEVRVPPADQPLIDACMDAKTPILRESEFTTTFSTDSRAFVKAFKDALIDFYKDCSKRDPGQIEQSIKELRISGEFRSATSMTNPGMKALLFSVVANDITHVIPDIQATAQPSAAGSTSLVSKTGAAAILALALESGALTNSVNGTTSTLSGNLEGIGSLLTGQAPISIDPNDRNSLRKIAGDVNLTATFSMAQPSSKSTSSTQPATGTSPAAGTQVNIPSSVGKLTGLTAKFTVRNPFNPHSSAFLKNWSTVQSDLKPATDEILLKASPLVTALHCDSCWENAIAEIAAGVKAGNPGLVAAAFDKYAATSLAHAKAVDSNFDTEFVDAVKATATYQQALKKAVDNAVGLLFTLEYDFEKPASQPESHVFKMVFGNPMSGTSGISSLLNSGSGAKSLFTANAGISLYGGAIPSSAKYGRLHYGQVSAEFDRPVSIFSSSTPSVFSAAGYWQYQPDPSVLNITQNNVAPGTSIDVPTQVLVGTAGSLWVTQVKLTVGNGKSGISVPIGVKWSNKTDLLTGSKVGGQVGITYDFSSLSSLLNGGK